jgi:hypothetical protein
MFYIHAYDNIYSTSSWPIYMPYYYLGYQAWRATYVYEYQVQCEHIPVKLVELREFKNKTPINMPRITGARFDVLHIARSGAVDSLPLFCRAQFVKLLDAVNELAGQL